MDVRSSGLVVVLYVLLGLSVAVVAGLSWMLMDRESRLAEELVVPGESLSGSPRRTGGAGQVPPLRQEAFAEAARRIDQLEALLDRKTDLLNKRTELLQKRSREYDALRKEADRYLTVLVDQLSEPPPIVNATDAKPTNQQAREALQAELERLRREVAESELVEETLLMELEELRGQLTMASERLAETELRDLLGGNQATDPDLAIESLVRVGEEALPALTTALRDERPDVRRWAASVLMEMGPAARPAVSALVTARQDTDPAVRQAAVRALAAINRSEP